MFTVLDDLKAILKDALQLDDEQVDAFSSDTPLLGHLPEFDSMAVVAILTLIEEHFGIAFADDEISADAFESIGSLNGLVLEKIS